MAFARSLTSCQFRTVSVVAVLLAVVMAGCGEKLGDAEDLTVAAVDSINAGACDVAPDGYSEAAWRTVCTLVDARRNPDSDLVVESTISQDTGEIGFVYYSDISLVNDDGEDQTLRLCFVGEGFLGRDPVLVRAALDGERLFEADGQEFCRL